MARQKRKRVESIEPGELPMGGRLFKRKGGKGWAETFKKMRQAHGIREDVMTLVPGAQTQGPGGKIGVGGSNAARSSSLAGSMLHYYNKVTGTWRPAPGMLQSEAANRYPLAFARGRRRRR